jgi:hypothetical protein
MNGWPTPWEAYTALPYHFPLIEMYPVVRIPIAGPEPFNTLAVVRGTAPVSHYGVADGKLHRHRIVAATPFLLAGNDPRVEPPFEHSTTAVLQMLQATDDTGFVAAADAVDGYFDDSGRWLVVADVADAFEDVYAGCNAYVSSWVLCYEPPIDHERSPGRPRGYASRVSEAQLRALNEPHSDAGVRKLERSARARRRQAEREEPC